MSDEDQAVQREREWLIAERKKRGWSTTKLADVARAIAQREGSDMKLRQQSISDFEQPEKAKRIPEWMRYVRMAFEEGEPNRDGDTEPRGELVYIRQLDIRYALGPGTVIDQHASATLIPFNLDFIRGLTHAPTEKLFIATGFGDSMEPVLLKHDLVLIDTNDTRLDLGDTLWALEYAEAGYIKRLRAVMRDGRRVLLILSANPDYPPEEADPNDVRIIGKVVWIARKM
ncbi:S24 family peptidase [Sphingomonas yantingensis]|uniref:Phage repressor protein C with HTH and peptisase S24 domain n=1 Tax=Sphingomonas yantingensis TaxID=1241761 RepID=A0A7W9EHW4_9SPHN|nr:helix-turn-helix transcriptional regulator [Sphingomonas yantingensis]MBB5697021.1 phage repressor protein C with HTH and peptisase S24 domain [Sphingomonas yantingensis]